jgi:hypothetical protein
MIPFSVADMQMLIGSAVFVMGSICVLLGVFVLVTRGYSRDIRALANHTARLGQKGMAEEITGLVRSATELVGALSGLVKTASGAGVFLIMLGMVMIASAYWIMTQIQIA